MADQKYSRADLEALAHRVAVQKGVDPTLVKAIIDQETGGKWGTTMVSPAGAMGLMQLMPNTAKGLGVTDPFDPAQNITGGVEYIKQQIRRFGDLGLALAAYNWGPGNAAKLESNPRGVRPPAETAGTPDGKNLGYVAGVFSRMGKFGETAAPSAVTMALFPNVGRAIGGAIGSKVSERTGGATPQSVERSLRAGMAVPPGPPAGAVAMAGPSAAPAPTAAPGGAGMAGGVGPMLTPPPVDVPGVSLPPSAAAPPEATMSPTQALLAPGVGAAPTDSLQAYLRAQFGPMADIADPFPKAFDAELSRLIDRA